MFYKILFTLSLLFFTACQQEQKEMPKDLTIMYSTGSTHADRAPEKFINIVPSGKSWKYTYGKKFRFISKDIGYKTKETILKTKDLTKSEVKAIFMKLLKYNFFKMKRSYINQEIMDGSYQTLKVSSKDKEKIVSLVNQENADFDAIIKSIEGI